MRQTSVEFLDTYDGNTPDLKPRGMYRSSGKLALAHYYNWISVVNCFLHLHMIVKYAHTSQFVHALKIFLNVILHILDQLCVRPNALQGTAH